MCQGYLKTGMMSSWRFDRRTHLAVTSWKTSTTSTELETFTFAKEDQRQGVHAKTVVTPVVRQSEGC